MDQLAQLLGGRRDYVDLRGRRWHQLAVGNSNSKFMLNVQMYNVESTVYRFKLYWLCSVYCIFEILPH